MRALFVCAMAVLIGGCSAEPLEAGDMVLVYGPDDGTDQPVTRIHVDKIVESGERTAFLDADQLVDRFSMGLGQPGQFDLAGFAADGSVQLRGRTLPINPPGFAGRALPLFVAAAGKFSRAPEELSTAPGTRPPAAMLSGRYLFLAGGKLGDEVATDAFDLATWSVVSGSPRLGCPAPPCTIRSLAVVDDTLGLAIGDDWAIWFELADGSSGDVSLPAGLGSFGELAGGRTVTARDGTAFVVGAARPTDESDAVLRVSPTGELTLIRLSALRSDAAVAWVDGRGLVVAGGSATAAGVELLAVGADSFVPLAYPADPTRGAALAPLGSASVLRVGGRDDADANAATVSLDLGCGASCAAVTYAAPVSLNHGRAFALDDPRILVVGDDDTGNTGAYLVSDTSVEPVALRQQRSDASSLMLPTGHVAVFGGTLSGGEPARAIELFAN